MSSVNKDLHKIASNKRGKTWAGGTGKKRGKIFSYGILDKTKSAGTESRKKNVSLVGKGKGIRPPNIFIYSRPEDGFTHHDEICCVLKVPRRGVKQSAFKCQVIDEHDSLRQCIGFRGERLLSSLIRIEKTKQKTGPVIVFIPYFNNPNVHVDIKIRARTDEDKWEYHDPLEDENVSSLAASSVPLRGVKILRFSCLEVVVTSRPKHDVLQVPVEGLTSGILLNNKKLIFSAPLETFPSDSKIKITSTNVRQNYIKSIAKFHTVLEDVRSVEFILSLACDDITKKEIELSSHDKPVKEEYRLPYPYRETLKRCREQFIEEIELEDLIDSMEDWGILCELKLNDVQTINREFNLRIKFKNAKSDEERAKLLLSDLEHCKTEDFDAFLVCLRETDQRDLANLLSKTVEDVTQEITPDESNTKKKIAETEETDSSEERKTVLIQRIGNGEWKTIDPVPEGEDPSHIESKLPSGFRDYDILAVSLKADADVSPKKISQAADLLANCNKETRMCFLCRQHIRFPQRVIFHCVRLNMVANSLKNLTADGFVLGQKEPIEFGICDGEEMQITFDPHIGLFNSDSDGVVKMQFYSYMQNIHFEGRLYALSENPDLKENGCDGFMYFTVETTQQKPFQRERIKLCLPKSLVLHPRSARSTLDVPVRALSKYIGYRMNSVGSHNEKLFTTLLEAENHTHRRLLSQTQRVCKENGDGERCEIFIQNWSLQRPRREDKVLAILHALFFDRELQSDATKFIQAYSGVLSDHCVEELAKLVMGKWYEIGSKLGVSKDELSFLSDEYEDEVERTVKMIEGWRLSNSAIELGSHIVDHILKVCEETQCSQKVINIINDASQFAHNSLTSELPDVDVN